MINHMTIHSINSTKNNWFLYVLNSIKMCLVDKPKTNSVKPYIDGAKVPLNLKKKEKKILSGFVIENKEYFLNY